MGGMPGESEHVGRGAGGCLHEIYSEPGPGPRHNAMVKAGHLQGLTGVDDVEMV